METVVMAVGLALVVLLSVWVALWFARNHFEDQARWENQDFVQAASRYESTIERLEKERRVAELIPKIVEAMNVNTLSLEKLEQTVNQLVLRSVGFQDRTTTRARQVGEGPVETTVGNRTVITRTPETRTDEGEEGFVDETTGKVVPLREPSPRELAATPPT